MTSLKLFASIMSLALATILLMFASFNAVRCEPTSTNVTVTVPVVTISNTSQDYVSIICQGNSQIQVNVISSDQGVVLNSQNASGNGSFISDQLQLVNVSSNALPYNVSLSFTSLSPFTINLTSISQVSNTTLNFFSVPANMTTQINMQLLYDVNSTTSPLATIDYLPGFPVWVSAIYIVIIPLFLAPAVMDRRGLKSVRKGWKAQDSLALYFRYLCYGIWIILPIMTVGLLAQIVFVNVFSIKQPIAVGDWLLSFIFAILFAIAYRVGKWRGIFDNIDEEE